MKRLFVILFALICSSAFAVGSSTQNLGEVEIRPSALLVVASRSDVLSVGNTVTPIATVTESYDQYGEWDGATFTARIREDVEFSPRMNCDASDNFWVIYTALNGVWATYAFDAMKIGKSGGGVVFTLRLNAGDQVSFGATQNTGGGATPANMNLFEIDIKRVR